MSRPGLRNPFLVLVFVLALVPRLLVALFFAKEPVWDGHYYHYGALRIAAGLGYSEDIWQQGVRVWKAWTHYPVGYSAFLAGLYKLFGSSNAVGPCANALLGALCAAASYCLARRFLSEKRARCAGLLVALHPGLIIYSALLMTELLSAFLVLVIGFLLSSPSKSKVYAALTGVVIGLASLVRPPSLLFLALVPIAISGSHWRWRITRSLIVTALAAFVILPWTWRNCRQMDGCALISTNGGWNLAIGALSTDGRFRTLRGSDGCPHVTGQVQQDRCWAEVGKRAIQKDFWRWVALMPAKLEQTYNHESFAVEYLHEANPKFWSETRRSQLREWLTAIQRALIACAVLGVIARPHLAQFQRGYGWFQLFLLGAWLSFVDLAASYSHMPFYWFAVLLPAIAALPGRPKYNAAGLYVLGVIFFTSATHAVFFGEDRYHVVVTPLFCILAAGALRLSADTNETSVGTLATTRK